MILNDTDHSNELSIIMSNDLVRLDKWSFRPVGSSCGPGSTWCRNPHFLVTGRLKWLLLLGVLRPTLKPNKLSPEGGRLIVSV